MLLRLTLLLALAQCLPTMAMGQVDDEGTPASRAGTPTFHFIGDRYRIGIGLDSEFDVVGEI